MEINKFKYSKRVFILGCILLLIIGIVVLLQLSMVSDFRELERSTSPNGLLDAVYGVELSGGALGSVSQEIYICNYKTNILTGEIILQGVHMKNVYIKWLSDSVLSVNYNSGRILQLKNELLCNDGDGSSRKIKIIRQK